ncbi:hypothetical protein RB195_024818 [Necator americanus]|uniref:Reverse transcriptase domain-containing protein n=1 Tax=Necator americanus TaxID=51031 RepID=A0ABR1EPQ2_NECAM
MVNGVSPASLHLCDDQDVEEYFARLWTSEYFSEPHSCKTSIGQLCHTPLLLRTLDEAQPREQAGFRQGFSCLDHIQNVSTVIEETRVRDRPAISIENYTIYCGDADENKVGGCAIAVRNDYKNLVEEFGSTSSRCAFLRPRDRRGRKLWIVCAHAPTETAEDNSKDAFYDELKALMSKIPSQQVVIVGIDANVKMGLEHQSDVLEKCYYPAECTSDNGDRLVDLCEQTGLIIAPTFTRNHRRNLLMWQGSFPQDTVSQEKPRSSSSTEIDTAGLRDEDCRKKFRPRVSIHVGVRTRKKLSDADSFTKCIQDAARETLPVLLPRKKFAFASAETKSTYNSVCVARSAGDFNQEKRLRRKLRRQLQQDRDNEWTSRAMEFEKAWEDRNPRKAYVLLKQYSGKMKRCSPVPNTANGVAVGDATLPIRKEHFKTLLNRLAPSAPELEHVHRPTYEVNEEPPTESKVLVCIQKMKNGKSGGDDRISAEMLKYLPPSGIREMKKIIPSIWADERIPDSWKHAIIIPLHKKLSFTNRRNYRGISLLRIMYEVLERIILDRLIKHREETTRDEQAGFPPGRSTIDQVFIVRRVTEIWQRYSKPMQLAFLDFEAAFDSPHRGRDLSVAHEHRLLQVQLKTDAPTCFVEFGQHSFRLADARCYQYGSAKRKWCSGLILSGPGAVGFLTDMMACRISDRRTSGMACPSSLRW